MKKAVIYYVFDTLRYYFQAFVVFLLSVYSAKIFLEILNIKYSENILTKGCLISSMLFPAFLNIGYIILKNLMEQEPYRSGFSGIQNSKISKFFKSLSKKMEKLNTYLFGCSVIEELREQPQQFTLFAPNVQDRIYTSEGINNLGIFVEEIVGPPVEHSTRIEQLKFVRNIYQLECFLRMFYNKSLTIQPENIYTKIKYIEIIFNKKIQLTKTRTKRNIKNNFVDLPELKKSINCEKELSELKNIIERGGN